MKTFGLILGFVFVYHCLDAQPIPTEVKKSVAFVYIVDSKGKLIPNGTCFFVGVKDTAQENSFALYTVTASHVIQDTGKNYLSEIYVRVNTKKGSASFIRYPLNGVNPQKNVFYHQDPSVDITVIQGAPDEKVFDYLVISDDFLTTKKNFQELNITEGSQIFYTGLFIPHIGENNNLPIVRFGRVALVADERIDWDGEKTELYLVESFVYGGNSGSPAFFYLGMDRVRGSVILGDPVLKFAGIIKGHFFEPSEVKVIETAKIPYTEANNGIAGVIPAFLLHEILFSSEVKALRGF